MIVNLFNSILIWIKKRKFKNNATLDIDKVLITSRANVFRYWGSLPEDIVIEDNCIL